MTASPNKVNTTVGRFANYTCSATYYTQATLQFVWKLNNHTLRDDSQEIIIIPSYKQLPCLEEISCASKLSLLVLDTFPLNSVVNCTVTAFTSHGTTIAHSSATPFANKGIYYIYVQILLYLIKISMAIVV